MNSDNEGVLFNCKLDDGDWVNCGSYNGGALVSKYYSVYYNNLYSCANAEDCSGNHTELSLGEHSFAAYATSVHGKVGPISYWNWTITGDMGDLPPELINASVSHNPAYSGERIYFF